MRTVGEILKEKREEKNISLEEVEKSTKIRKELLQALEADDYSKLPPATFVQGFIKIYGRFLNLDGDKLLAIFRRGFKSRLHPPRILESFSNPIDKRKFRVTPARVIGGALVLIVLLFFTYLWVEYRQFIGAPNLVVDSPKEGQTVDIPEVLVEGRTDPEVKIAVNNQEIGVEKDGHFKEDIKLSQTTNQVIIVATSRFGQNAKIERTVFVKKAS